ncbi:MULTISPECIES: DUF3300 domain-containing protein [unclassified Shewanella]|uniref:DUF3300 domain-containing protein n=1 Tax=unclassified Shewanella TaxID=196818 RepID=UPI001BB98D14|nr:MULTISPECIES: DUF3300 domain-containing protein [unclassified Shewanella]GIU19729.1 hypothetical protein TUM4444_36450 [Shewanella sp. MBTL60-112-B1]GIU27686.1 hypothetical protein TUM4445_08120 [Shewanella sp. MBTL60-112-B2]
MNRLKKYCCSLVSALVIAIPLMIATPSANAQDDDQEYSAYSESQYSEGQLAQMLAPIALYPDSLLTHILIAATYPLEVVQAHRWQQSKQHLSTQAQIAKAEDKDWDPSVVALIAFPNVLQKLSDELNWTQSLGDAFLQDEAQVLASIQTLRQQADDANSLEQMDNMQVTRVSNQIVIEPVRKEIVYVPYYDPRTVYGYWRWYSYPPIYWAVYPGYVRPGYGHFYWRAGVHISFNYYFSAFHWHKRHVVVVHHHNSHKYRHRGRIVTSHGAERWAHKPQHRRGVAYSNNALRHKYKSHHPSRSQSKTLQRNERKHVNHRNSLERMNSLERTRSPERIKNQMRVNKLERTKSSQFNTSSKPSSKTNARPHNKHSGQSNKLAPNHKQHFARSAQPKVNKSNNNRLKHQSQPSYSAKPQHKASSHVTRSPSPRASSPRASSPRNNALTRSAPTRNSQHKPRKD